MKIEDINWYLELAFGKTFEPVPEVAEGKIRLQCTRKTADAMREGVTRPRRGDQGAHEEEVRSGQEWRRRAQRR